MYFSSFSTRNATSNETGGSHCEQVQRYYPNESQHIAAEIAKYIIMCLAAFKILGEVGGKALLADS